MTAFLFINSSPHAGLARRVDLTNFASLFGDRDEPAPPPRLRQSAARVALTALVLVGTIGDAILVARPSVLASVIATPHDGTARTPAVRI